MELKAELHEVQGRFYVVEPKATSQGYAVEVRREGEPRLLWRCSVDFLTHTEMANVYGDSIRAMIDLAKHDLDAGFIKDSN